MTKKMMQMTMEVSLQKRPMLTSQRQTRLRRMMGKKMMVMTMMKKTRGKWGSQSNGGDDSGRCGHLKTKTCSLRPSVNVAKILNLFRCVKIQPYVKYNLFFMFSPFVIISYERFFS